MTFFGSLDNGYRSKCCYAIIRVGFKTIKHTKIRSKIWVCTRCLRRDMDIIPREQVKSQTDPEDLSFLEDVE